MSAHDWLRAQLDWQAEAGLWVAAPFLAYVLASNLAWFTARRKGTLGQAAARLRDWPGGRWLLILLRWALFAGPPYAALRLGIVSPRSMGLGEIDWVYSAGVGGAVAAGALALLTLSWWSYRRALPPQSETVEPSPPRQPLAWLLVLAETVALQLHWAFYRSVLAAQPWPAQPEWRRWAGLGLLLVEGMLNPWLRHGLKRPFQADPILRRLILALVTTSLFLLTGNFWLCWALHALFEIAATAMNAQGHSQTRSHTSP
jgi:hypothetical protein